MQYLFLIALLALWFVAVIITPLVFFVAVTITPVVMLAGFLCFKACALIFKKKISADISQYWLSEKEKLLFKEEVSEMDELHKLRSHLQKMGNHAGIGRNLDGNFDERNRLGKWLNENIGILNRAKQSLLYGSQVDPSRPRNKWKSDHEKFNSYNIKASGFWWGLVFWIVAFIYHKDTANNITNIEVLDSYWVLAMFFFEIVEAIFHIGTGGSAFFEDTSEKIPLTIYHVKAVAIVSGISLTSCLFRWRLIKKKPVYFCQESEIVTIENVDRH